MNVAILGANGYLGRHLVNCIISTKDWSVTGFGTKPAFSGKERVEYRQMDVCDQDQVAECGDFDLIFFFSGLSGTGISYRNYADFVRVNEIGLLNLLDRYKDSARKPKIIFPSSRLVYKGMEGMPLTESAKKESKTVYAASKYAGEMYLGMYRNLYGLDYTIFRICVPYGQTVEGRLSYGTVGFFLERAMAGKPIVLYGDGSLRRTFTHVTDVCRQVVEVSALGASAGECFNVDGETFSLKEVAGMIAGKYGVPVQFTDWPAADLKMESGDTIFDATKIRALVPNPLTCSLARWISQ
jgi:UDP-glucose 4-epimerase